MMDEDPRRGRMAFPAEQQQRVDAYFQSTASHWRAIYQVPRLSGMIYRQRLAVSLALIDRLALPQETRILEIGCGAGVLTLELAHRGYIVEAVDTVDAMLDLTRQAASEVGVGHRVSTRISDVHCLDFDDEVFRVVLAIGVTPWLHSPQVAMKEIARVVTPGGSVIVTADNRWRLNHLLDPRFNPVLAPVREAVTRLLRQFGRQKSVIHGVHTHLYSPKAFDELLASVGLEKVTGLTVGFGPFSFLGYRVVPDSVGRTLHHPLQSLADHHVPGLRSTGAHYIVLARKPQDESSVCPQRQAPA